VGGPCSFLGMAFDVLVIVRFPMPRKLFADGLIMWPPLKIGFGRRGQQNLLCGSEENGFLSRSLIPRSTRRLIWCQKPLFAGWIPDVPPDVVIISSIEVSLRIWCGF